MSTVVLIGWGERFPQILPAERIEIELRHAGCDARDSGVPHRGLNKYGESAVGYVSRLVQ